MKKQINNSINFLEVKIIRDIKDNYIPTLAYHKPTFTGVLLNWKSLTSIKYQEVLTGCLLDRSFKNCSSTERKFHLNSFHRDGRIENSSL